MSSKSPGTPHLTPQKQQHLLPNTNTNSCCGSPGDFPHTHHNHQHHPPSTTSPDSDLVVSRTLSGLSDGSSCGMSSRDSGYCVNTSDGASTCSSSTTDATENEGGTLLVLEPKSLRSFTTNDEYLYAMKEDLADWFACLYKLDVTAESFFPLLETGVLLCQHANKVQDFSQQRREQGERLEMRSYFIRSVPQGNVPYRENVKPQTFQARDNVSNFIAWGKKLGIPEVLSFETDDLVLRKNEKNVILCLLEIARVGAKLGMLAPTLVQMEEEIDAELAGEEVKPKAQIKTCDMRSLDEMVRDLVGRCTCPVQFPMVKVGDGKYKIGDSRSLIFVRILRNHVMVRVGGGWDTLENYLNKHDPCQCNYRGHRATSLGPSNTPKAVSSASGQRSVANSRSSSSTDTSTPARSSTSTNKILSPRRMSQPAVAVTTTSGPGRNRSTSPKQPARSKSPTLIISRHLQGSHKPSFSVSNHKGADTSGSFTASDGGGGGGSVSSSVSGVAVYKGNGGGGGAASVSKSWSHSSGAPRPRTPSRQGTKSPSPCPSNGRLRSPSPLNASVSGPNQARSHPHKVIRASSSSTLLAKGKGQGCIGGEVKVGTPRSIKRAAMNSQYEDEEAEERGRECDEEDDEYDNDDVDDDVTYDDDDDDDDDDRWRQEAVDPELLFACDDMGACRYPIPGSVSFDDACDGATRSRSGLERVSESETSESSGQGKGSNMPMEKINTMTLTEFKSLLTTALSVPDDQQQPTSKQSLNDRENPNSFSKPSSLAFSSPSGGITSTASTPGASEANRQLNWDSLRDKARLVRDSISSSVNSRKASLGSTGTGSPGMARRSLPQSPDEDGSRHRVPYTDHGGRPKTPQSVRRSGATPTAVSRPKTPTSAISRPKTPTSIARPKTPSSSSGNQSRSRTPSSLDRNPHQREEYKMARPKTPSQMKREAVAKVAGAISNWVESRNELDSAQSHRGRPKTPVSSSKYSMDDNDEDNDEIMGTFANNHVETLASSMKERPNTPSRIPKPCFTPRPATPKQAGNEACLSSSAKDPDQFRPSIPARPPQSLSLSQQNSFSSPVSSAATTPDLENLSRTPGSSNIPATKVVTRSQYQPAQSAPSTPAGTAKDNRGKSYKDMYITKRATTPTQSSSSSTIPRSQPSRCVTPGPREKWSLGERSKSTTQSGNSQSRISSYQNGSTKRRGSLSSEHVSSSVQSNQFVVTNEITFSDDEEINEMLKNAAIASASEKQERKPRSASVDARRLVRQNARQKDTVVISRNTKGKHNVQVSKQSSVDSNHSDSVRSRGHAHSTDRSKVTAMTAARFRSQTPDPSMFRRKMSTAKSVGGDDLDGRSGTKSINRTEAWVDSTLSDTKRKLPPRPKRANTLGGDVPVSDLAPRPLEEVIAILPEQQAELVGVDTEALDAPAEDPEMYRKMEKLFEKYREMELRASVNEVPGGGKVGGKKMSNPSSSNRSVDASSKSTPSVASMKTSSGSVGSSSGRSSSHHPTPSSASHHKMSSGKSHTSVPSTGSGESSTGDRYTRAASVPKTFQNVRSSQQTTTPRHQHRSANPDNHSHDRNGHGYEPKTSTPSLKDIDAATAKDPTALISKIKEILRVRPRKDENGKVRTRIPAPAALNKNRRSKSVSNLLDQVAEMTAKDGSTDYNRSVSNSSHNNEHRSRRAATPDMNQTNSTSSTNIAYSEFVFTDKGEEADSVSDFTRTWSVQSDSSDSNNRCETPVPKLSTPLTTGRSTFINRKLERSGRGLSQDKENALSNSQSSLSSRSALSTTEDEADYV